MRPLYFHRQGRGKISEKYDIMVSYLLPGGSNRSGPSKYLVETESCILLLISKASCHSNSSAGLQVLHVPCDFLGDSRHVAAVL